MKLKLLKSKSYLIFYLNTSYLKLRTSCFQITNAAKNIAVKYLNSVKIEGPTSNCKSFTNIVKAYKNDKIVTNIQLQHGYQYLVDELCRLVDFKAC